MKPRENTKEFTHIGSIINNTLKSYRSKSDEELGQVWKLWNNAVGDVIAKDAQPAAFKGKLLLVHVSSSAWIQQLQFLKKDMIIKLNNALGKHLIEDIKFKVGPL
ncbi:DUF721 domain-containing protein [Desulfonema magnum]|nr:DUF721 domain-containing protein [Desulfonema magnum]